MVGAIRHTCARNVTIERQYMLFYKSMLYALVAAAPLAAAAGSTAANAFDCDADAIRCTWNATANGGQGRCERLGGGYSGACREIRTPSECNAFGQAPVGEQLVRLNNPNSAELCESFFPTSERACTPLIAQWEPIEINQLKGYCRFSVRCPNWNVTNYLTFPLDDARCGIGGSTVCMRCSEMGQ